MPEMFPLELTRLFGQNGSFMATPFSPTPQDVERYRSLRALSMALHHKIIKTIPRQAYEEIGDAIGIRHNGVLVFDSEDMTAVMADCCLYDWFENGKNLIQRYAETYPAKPGTDESLLLQASLQAKYRVLQVQSALTGAGLYCHDALNGEELFLMDLALSQSVPSGKVALATRTLPLGEYWMTGGAGLPIHSGTDVLAASRQIQSERREPLETQAMIALSVVRACLAAGAADQVAYAGPQAAPRKPRREPRWSGSKRRRR